MSKELSRLMAVAFAVMVTGAHADDDAPAKPLPAATPATKPSSAMIVPEPAWSPRPPRPPAVPPISLVKADSTGEDQQVKFSSDAKWDLAGYNNDEIVYTIFITNQDSRIIRCTVQLNGFFFENGEKHSVSDRQSLTVFPDQRAPAGNWQGMDEKSGATYSVKCHPAAS